MATLTELFGFCRGIVDVMLKASMSTGYCQLLLVTYTFVVANIGVANIVPVLNATTSIGHSSSVEEAIFRRAWANGAEHMDA